MYILFIIVLLVNPLDKDPRLQYLTSISAQYGTLYCGERLQPYLKDPIGFIIALACVESSCGKYKQGPKGEIGILQIHPQWLKKTKLKKKDLENDFINICFGVELLLSLIKDNKTISPELLLQLWHTGSLQKPAPKFIQRWNKWYLKINK